MANTTNFGWETPDDTDLVKDGAAAMRTLGNAIDASLVDLKGGTTNQVLAKNSNTDMDFKWVETDDTNAIQNTIVDAKGDLISASAADVPARLAVGNNGESLIADSSTTTGLRWQGNYAAGKNKIINGDFSIWQRGTTFTNLATNTYTADRWYASSSDSTIDFARSTFTPGAAPVAGYESEYFMNIAIAATDSDPRISQRIEDVRTLAGQTVTVSFWAKSTVTTDALRWVRLQQFMGSGGSATINTDSAAISLSATWTRYSVTLTLPSLSGATIGANNWLGLFFGFKASTAQTIDIWGVQLEAGNVATAFQTATGTLAGELAACQRYYERATSDSAYGHLGYAKAFSANTLQSIIPFKVTKRVAPTAVDTSAMSTFLYETGGTSGTTPTSAAISAGNCSTQFGQIDFTKTGGFTTGAFYFLMGNNSTSAFIGWSAEL